MLHLNYNYQYIINSLQKCIIICTLESKQKRKKKENRSQEVRKIKILQVRHSQFSIEIKSTQYTQYFLIDR